jgi:hypothetical protein
MTELKRWDDASATNSDEARAAGAMKVAAQILPRAVHAGDWEAVLLRAARQDRSWPVLAVVAITMLVAVAAGLGWQRYTKPELSASPEARVEMRDGNTVLAWGRLEITTSRPMSLTTPHLEDLTVSGRVAADVDAATTRIDVYEGVAQVRIGSELVELRAGQSGVWPTTPALPASLRELTSPAPGACDERPEAERLDCLVASSNGTGLSAQVALFQRASMPGLDPDAAQLLWRESLVRFPAGVLHPEVRLSLLRQLVEARQFDAAVREALAFEQACAWDPRIPDVRALRLALERRR